MSLEHASSDLTVVPLDGCKLSSNRKRALDNADGLEECSLGMVQVYRRGLSESPQLKVMQFAIREYRPVVA